MVSGRGDKWEVLHDSDKKEECKETRVKWNERMKREVEESCIM